MDDVTLSPLHIFPSLRLARYRFVLEPKGPMNLPAYQGSTWRGLLGNALLDVVCPWDEKECASCPNRKACAYHYLYEAGLNEKAFANLPRPYIFSVADTKGPHLTVDMTLVGNAAKFLPHLTAAWRRAAQRGAGKGRGGFMLTTVFSLPPNERRKPIYVDGDFLAHDASASPLREYMQSHVPCPPWKVSLQTPLRLRRDGRNMNAIHWRNAFRSLSIRLSMMTQHYCGGAKPDKETWQRVSAFLADPGTTRARTRWFDWKRFSSTQQTHVPMGGLVGDDTITPPGNVSVWWEWWRTARLFHLGKGTAMGMGKIEINGAHEVDRICTTEKEDP